MKYLPLSALAVSMTLISHSHAIEFDVYGAFSMSEDPVGIYYDIVTGDVMDELKAGEGIGLYLGHTQRIAGPMSVQVRTGYHFGFASVSGPAGEDTFSYLPVYANLMINVSEETSLIGGLFYPFNINYSVNNSDEVESIKYKAEPGFNLGLRWTAVPKSLESTSTFFMEGRFQFANFEMTEIIQPSGASVDVNGLFEPFVLSNIGLAIGLKY